MAAVLHHVALEVAPDDVARVAELWELIGFRRVPAPEAIAEYVTWLERQGTQVHLMRSEAAAVPPLGHPAVVAAELDETLGRLERAGFELEEHRQLWGERRFFVLGPGGLRVELMEAPPPPS